MITKMTEKLRCGAPIELCQEEHDKNVTTKQMTEKLKCDGTIGVIE